MPPGLYAYDPLGHRLAPRGPAPGDAAPGAVAVLTLSPGRTASHYGHRSWPLLLLDAGHTVAALVLAALALDLHAPVCLDADAALLAAAAGLPRSGRWDRTWPGTAPEYPVAAVHLVPPGAGPLPGGPLASWAALPLGTAPRPGPAPHEEGRRAGLVLEALTTDGPPGTWWPARPPRALSSAGALRAALRVRRSAPPPLEGVPGDEELAAVLEAAVTAAPQSTAWCAAVGGERPGLLEQRPEASRPAATAATAATGAPDSPDPGGAAASPDFRHPDFRHPDFRHPDFRQPGSGSPAPDGPPARGVPGPEAALPPGAAPARGGRGPPHPRRVGGGPELAGRLRRRAARARRPRRRPAPTSAPRTSPPAVPRASRRPSRARWACAAGPSGRGSGPTWGAALGREPAGTGRARPRIGTGRTGRTNRTGRPGRRPGGEDHDRRPGGETR
ncbi:hypothetical protein GQS52_25740 [Streptomyces sp. SCUT-3]|uniref:hypothetical protein n=1 Tax=Streptomyces sp. SCUT-3 TaxID=2684469 RepID=UPI0015FAFB4C|nr:hypothetical protein GQS52_25740 [Streptomyces sp. SCUT-3]